jgi:hypothetical protein
MFDEDVTARVAFVRVFIRYSAPVCSHWCQRAALCRAGCGRETTLSRIQHDLRNPIAAFSIDLHTFRALLSRRRRDASGTESAMSFLSKAFRRKPESLPPWAAIDQESLRISAAMEHVQEHGNLDAFPGNQNEKLALMLTASRQGLVSWNRRSGQYELTGLGRERLGMRQALQEGGPMNVKQPGGAMDLPLASGTSAGRRALGSGAIMAGVAGLAIGATAMALLPGSTSKAPPSEKIAATAPSKPAETGTAPRQVYPLPQTAAPAPAPVSAQPEPPKAQSAEPPKTSEPKQAAIHPGEAGKVVGALAGAESPPAAAPTLSAPAQAERGATNETAPVTSNETAPAKNEAMATTESKPPPASPPARAAKPAPATKHSAAAPPPPAPAAPPPPARSAKSQSAPTPPPAASAEPPPPPEPATAEAKPAPAPKPEPNRQSAERSRSRHATPPASPEQAGLAQSKEQPSARATERSSSRSRHAEQQKNWTESRRKSEKSRRDYVEEDEGEPEDGVIVRRFEERGGPPAVVMGRDRGEASRRDGRDIREIEERRPGFAFRDSREPQRLGFGDREGGRFGDRESGPPRFGLFDWLFR